MNHRLVACAALTLLTATVPTPAQGDPETIAKIVAEGKGNNQTWSHLEYLSHEIGTRLTGSSRTEAANNWTRQKFEEFGLSNCHLSQWGEIPVRFDRGPSHLKIVAPFEEEIAFTTRAWSAGTNGPTRGVVVKRPKDMAELEAVRDRLLGAWILAPGRGRGRGGVVQQGEEGAATEDVVAALKEAGIAGFITSSRNELIITSGGWNDLDPDNLPTEVTAIITRTDYDRLNSRLADGENVEVEINADNVFTKGPFPLYNTIAEIPGTTWPEQVVIVSGHLDSWDGPGAMGTQDNGTGSSVTLEAARLLMAAGAQPKRTIRFILWTGEEQGLYGSRAYVESLSEEERANISCCLVDDGGTNYEGGLGCIESMAPMLRAAVAPASAAFPDLPVKVRVSERWRQSGGSDHASFNSVGIPGFFWDESGSGGREGKNYTFIHHTQHDTPRYAVPEYLVQSSVCAAITAYNLACADSLLPRVPEEDRSGRGRRTETPPVDAAAAAAAPPAATDAPFEVAESPVNGTWTATFESPSGGGPSTFTMTLEVSKDGRLRGGTKSEIGDAAIQQGTFNAETGELKFTIDFQGSPIQFNAKTEGAAMKGTMGMEGMFNAQFNATKAG